MYIKQLALCLSIGFALSFTACSDGDSNRSRSSSEIVDEDDDNTTATLDDSYTYRLPVVFHILYTNAADPTQYVSVERLGQILAHVNELYRGDVYGESQNIRVQFFLAEYDEQGRKLPIPGVDYIRYEGEYPIDAYRFLTNQEDGNEKYLWEPNEYVNVMLFHYKQNHSGGILLGLSHLPYIVRDETDLEGLHLASNHNITKRNLRFAYSASINSRYINDESSRYTDPAKRKEGYLYSSTDINVTLAHELGHYLGLHHTFSETENGGTANGCEDTDYCRDTPSYNKDEYDAYVTYYLNTHSKEQRKFSDLLKRFSCTNQMFIATNLMDYAVNRSYEFTADQRYRMRQVLYNSPLMPGPKKRKTRASDVAPQGYINLPIRVVR